MLRFSDMLGGLSIIAVRKNGCRPLSSRGAESARAAPRRIRLCFLPLNRFVAGNNQLGNTVARLDGVNIFSEVDQDHANLAAIAGIDGTGCVRYRDRML